VITSMSVWYPGEGVVGESPVMRALSARIDRAARSTLPVLIRGETGTGKELVARAIHRRSTRSAGPFVTENCAALAEGLLESELFGHEQGSFTGADKAHSGLFARAHGGTLFIDEVGDMSPAMQAKLLRVLQEGEVRPVGGQRSRAVDVRVVAATHKDLEALCRQGLFREDLLYRLAVLVETILRRIADEPGGRSFTLGEDALDAMLGHDWPGNVRELENAVRVAALFAQDGVLRPEAFPFKRGAGISRAPAPAAEDDATLSYADLLASLEGRERTFVRNVLDKARGNKAEAARRLGITRYALYRTMRRLGLEIDEEVPEGVA
jgi:transcriptional regulator with GAF, ATPase, and Fis domain